LSASYLGHGPKGLWGASPLAAGFVFRPINTKLGNQMDVRLKAAAMVAIIFVADSEGENGNH